LLVLVLQSYFFLSGEREEGQSPEQANNRDGFSPQWNFTPNNTSEVDYNDATNAVHTTVDESEQQS